MGDLQTHLPTHSLSVRQFLTNTSMTPLSHPPYSPDLALSDYFFFLFFWMKKVLKGKPFADVEEVLKKGRSTKRHQNQRIQRLF